MVIAVIDDDAGVRTALRELLRAAEFEARTFVSAEDYLECCGTLADVECLIVDVHLPGMSGVALLRTLSARGAVVPAVLVSGRDDPATRELLHSAPPTPFLHKPFGDAELLAAITWVRRGMD
jgi:two-component system CheB/CheR fusion protein